MSRAVLSMLERDNAHMRVRARARVRVRTRVRWENFISVGFESLTIVVRRSSDFWDISTCSPLKVNWHLRENVTSICHAEN
jgi:hypothetical protein